MVGQMCLIVENKKLTGIGNLKLCLEFARRIGSSTDIGCKVGLGDLINGQLTLALFSTYLVLLWVTQRFSIASPFNRRCWLASRLSSECDFLTGVAIG